MFTYTSGTAFSDTFIGACDSTANVYNASLTAGNTKSLLTDADTDNTRKRCLAKSIETGMTELYIHVSDTS